MTSLCEDFYVSKRALYTHNSLRRSAGKPIFSEFGNGMTKTTCRYRYNLDYIYRYR